MRNLIRMFGVLVMFVVLSGCGDLSSTTTSSHNDTSPTTSTNRLAGKTMYGRGVDANHSRFAEWTFYANGSGICSKPQTTSPALNNAPFNWSYNDSTGRFIITNSHGLDTGGSVITLHWNSNTSGYAVEEGWGTLFTFTLS